MNIRAVTHLISYLIGVTSLAMFAGAGVSACYGETNAIQGLLLAGGISIVSAAIAWYFTRGGIELSRRDGFGVATFGWLFASIFGALPYMFTAKVELSFIPAVFETMSGYTTTGASVLSELEQIPKGILFWRAMTHFFGGMGVLVLCVAILPFLGVALNGTSSVLYGTVADFVNPSRVPRAFGLFYTVIISASNLET